MLTRQTNAYVARPVDGTLYDVLDLILDKGLVIDAYVRVSVVGIDLLTVDVRVVIASVDTYLRFAERVNRLQLGESQGRTISDLTGGRVAGAMMAKRAGKHAKSAMHGLRERAEDLVHRDGNGEKAERHEPEREEEEDVEEETDREEAVAKEPAKARRSKAASSRDREEGSRLARMRDQLRGAVHRARREA